MEDAYQNFKGRYIKQSFKENKSPDSTPRKEPESLKEAMRESQLAHLKANSKVSSKEIFHGFEVSDEEGDSEYQSHNLVRITDNNEVLKRIEDDDKEKSSERINTLYSLSESKAVYVPRLKSIKMLEKVKQKNESIGEFVDELIDHIRFCDAVSARSFSFEPVILVGEPGVGKTHVAKAIADAMCMTMYKIPVSEAQEGFYLSGSQRGYSNATPGRIADRMSICDFANPILLLDEIDKAPLETNGERKGLLAPLLQLFEPESSSEFRDLCLDVRIDASRVSYICTANSIENIPKPLISRCRVIEIDRPCAKLMEEIAATIFCETYKRFAGNEVDKSFIFSASAKARFESMTPREVRMIARKAVIKLVSDNPFADSYSVDHSFFNTQKSSEKRFVGFINTNSRGL